MFLDLFVVECMHGRSGTDTVPRPQDNLYRSPIHFPSSRKLFRSGVKMIMNVKMVVMRMVSFCYNWRSYVNCVLLIPRHCFLPHTFIQFSLLPISLTHSCAGSICLAQCAKTGFKIFPPPVQICSTLKWISLFHLSLGLTGKWIILTGPVWSLFNPSPWFCVFLEQEGGVSYCWHFAALM